MAARGKKAPRGAGNKARAADSAAGGNGAERVAVAKTYKLYIDGKFPRSESGRYYRLERRGSGGKGTGGKGTGAKGSSGNGGALIANPCRASRKDFRDAVVAARAALAGWSSSSAYLRAQIVYRTAEMLEGRREQFIDELVLQGVPRAAATDEVRASIDRLVYYAGWADKYQQVFSSVNPVSSPHFNFSVLEPMGIVAIVAPESSGLLGLVSNIAPAVAGGNTCVVLASQTLPLSAVSFAEVLQASDFPGGVVNILTGLREELLDQFASHMDVNAVVLCEGDGDAARKTQQLAADNIKRVVLRPAADWDDDAAQSPYHIGETQEVKTTWHPIGG